MAGRGYVRWVAFGLGLSQVWAPGVVAAPAGPALFAPSRAAAKPKADDPLTKVSALAQEAQTRFETADYSGAIDLWTQAYAALPDEPAYAQQRSVLAYQIAQACVEAYAIDPNLIYLRKAERLFESYRATIDPADRETAEDVQKTLDELRAKIAEAEARAAASGDAAVQAELEAAERERAEQEAREEAERKRREEAAAQQRRAAAEREVRRYKGLTLAGAGVAAWGAASLGVMAFGLARGAKIDEQGDAAVAAGDPDPNELHDLLQKGTTANKLAIAFGAVGGALIVTGVGLVAAGTAGYRRARRDLAVAPGWLPGGGSLSVRFRF